MSMADLFSSQHIATTRGAAEIIRRYARKDNWHELDTTTGNLGYGWMHYGLLRALRPKRILVIGSKYGFVPAICAIACRDNRRGVVDFVDAGYDRNNPDHPNHWGGAGVWRRVSARQHFGALAPFIRLHVTTSGQFARESKKTSWDYIYLDGDHSYDGVKKDVRAFLPRLAPGGMLLLHDIHMRRMGTLIFGVHRVWAELKRRYPNATMELPGTYGLGMLHKPR